MIGQYHELVTLGSVFDVAGRFSCGSFDRRSDFAIAGVFRPLGLAVPGTNALRLHCEATLTVTPAFAQA